MNHLRHVAKIAYSLREHTSAINKSLKQIKQEARDVYAGLHFYRNNFIEHCRIKHMNSH